MDEFIGELSALHATNIWEFIGIASTMTAFTRSRSRRWWFFWESFLDSFSRAGWRETLQNAWNVMNMFLAETDGIGPARHLSIDRRSTDNRCVKVAFGSRHQQSFWQLRVATRIPQPMFRRQLLPLQLTTFLLINRAACDSSCSAPATGAALLQVQTDGNSLSTGASLLEGPHSGFATEDVISFRSIKFRNFKTIKHNSNYALKSKLFV